jgi:hypothetical protein
MVVIALKNYKFPAIHAFPISKNISAVWKGALTQEPVIRFATNLGKICTPAQFFVGICVKWITEK